MAQDAIELILFIFLICTALCIAWVRNLLEGAMLLGIFSLLSAGMLLLMDAVDVSFTEAAVGAGISTVLFLGALSLIGYHEKPISQHRWVGKLVVIGAGALLVYGTLDMPHYGASSSPIDLHLAPEYIAGTQQEIQIPNIVTAVLASYRGFDTFGETTVVLTAAVGALLLLGGPISGRREDSDSEDTP